MAREEFLRDIRHAVSFMAPRVEAESPFTDAGYIAKMLRGTDRWLARGVVAAFHTEDFADLDAAKREALVQAVNDFLVVAETINGKGPPTQQQRDAAVQPFSHIIRVAQDLVRKDWLDASARLLQDAEGWAKEAGWPTKRYAKEVTEDFIGRYMQERLVFSSEGQQLALVPVGRFAPGTDGVFDLAVMPAYDSVMVVREGQRWSIHAPAGEGGQRDWSKEAFFDTSLKLARLP